MTVVSDVRDGVSIIRLARPERRNALVPELLQDDATPAALSAALLALWRDKPARERQLARFHEIHHLLRQNTAEKAAEAVLGMLEKKNG